MRSAEEVDVSIVHHAWLSPQGEWHTVHLEGHDYYARNVLNEEGSYKTMYGRGFVKLSSNEWYDEQGYDRMRVTQAQFDQIERWYRSGACARSFDPSRFEIR